MQNHHGLKSGGLTPVIKRKDHKNSKQDKGTKFNKEAFRQVYLFLKITLKLLIAAVVMTESS